MGKIPYDRDRKSRCSEFSKTKGGVALITQQQKIGSYIAVLRKAKNMTQNDLAQRLNVSFQAVSKWERGVSHN
ncbi:MAG TPA: helix-turn-helix transcriptional regulator [Candidatus Merdivicinus intestinigallinarum]|nr:helix-turn-helix transcriptional regulator [Candidatus Merdivicinus intestinigallinarum]